MLFAFEYPTATGEKRLGKTQSANVRTAEDLRCETQTQGSAALTTLYIYAYWYRKQP
jgi:hypothetical protein